MTFSWILCRYLSKNFLRSLFIVFGIVFGIIFLFDFSELLRKASAKTDISVGVLLHLTALKVPGLIQQILPFIFFFASILCFWSLNRQNEVTALKSSGVSVWEILTPLLGTALLLGAMDLCLFNPLSSRMMMRYEHLENRYFQDGRGSLALSDSGLWVRERLHAHNNVIHIRHLDLDQKKLLSVIVIQFDDQNRFRLRIDAQTGELQGKKLILHNVWQSSPGNLPEFRPHLAVPTTLSFYSLQDSGASPGSISFWELPSFVRLLEKSGLSPHKHLLYWHSLLARLVWLLAMILLGATCSMRPVRSGTTSLFIGIGAIMAFALYFIRDMTYSLGNAQSLPVVMAAWIPVGISLLLGLSLLLHNEDK